MSRPRAGLRDRWVTAVYADREIGDGCRVLLLLLATRMTDAGRVSVPRDELGELLNIEPRRVTGRITEATRRGFLAKRGGGWRGLTAQYEALIPPAKVASERPPLSVNGGGLASTFSVHLSPGESDGKVAAERPPIARVTNASRERDDQERNVGASPDRDETKQRSDKRAPIRLRLADLSPWTRLAYPIGLTAA